jgi:ribosomal protein L7/L12
MENGMISEETKAQAKRLLNLLPVEVFGELISELAAEWKGKATYLRVGLYDVVLQATGTNKISVIKTVRSESNLSLTVANDLVSKAPVLIAGGLTSARAEDYARKLRDAGGTAAIMESK